MTASFSRLRFGRPLMQGGVVTYPQISPTLHCRSARSPDLLSFIPPRLLDAASSSFFQRRQFSKMPRPIVYQTDASPPSRAVRLAAAAIGVDVEVRNINLLAGEHLTEEFTKMNPEHTVPTLDDDGFYLWDSHAIICYLADKYGKDDSLYPKDLRRRALINQRLHFESGVLFARLRFISFPLFMRHTDTVAQEKLDLLDEAYGHLDKCLEGKKWLVGDSYTLADISCVTSISSLECLLPFAKYPNLTAWLKRCEADLPGYAEINATGTKVFHDAMAHLIKSKI